MVGPFWVQAGRRRGVAGDEAKTGDFEPDGDSELGIGNVTSVFEKCPDRETEVGVGKPGVCLLKFDKDTGEIQTV